MPATSPVRDQISSFSSFSGEVEMICQDIWKAFTVKLAQTKVVVRHDDIFMKLFFNRFHGGKAHIRTYSVPTPPSSKKCFWHCSQTTIFFIDQISSFSGEVEMICQDIWKAFTVKLAQTKTIPVTAAVFIKIRGMSTFGAIVIYRLKLQSIWRMPPLFLGPTGGGATSTGDGGRVCEGFLVIIFFTSSRL